MEKHVRLHPAAPARGIILPPTPDTVNHDRLLPPAELAPIVRHFWTVSWNFAQAQTRENLPHPALHLVFENGRSEIVGVPSKRFTVELSGKDRVIGVRLHPGAISAFRKLNTNSLKETPASFFTDQRILASEIFGNEIEDLKIQIETIPWPDCLAQVISFLETRMTELSKDAILSRRLVERLETEADLKRVEHLCDDEGISPRSLQRLFQKYVGVTPKWVICRFRLHEALSRIENGEVIAWSDLADDLGYYDQSHFINDFVNFVGCTPEEYGRRGKGFANGLPQRKDE